MNIPKSVVWATALATVVTGTVVLSQRVPLPQSAFAATRLSVTGEPADRSPEVYQAGFVSRTVADALAEAGVSVAPEDKVFAFPDPALGAGSELRVFRAQNVSVTDGKSVSQGKTWAGTVGEYLTEKGIEVGDQDIVEPSAATAIPVGRETFAISITRVAVTTLETTSPIPFTTKYTDDPTLEKGTETVKVAGKNGVLTTTHLIRRENGVKVSDTVTGQKRTTEPVTKEILRGTKVIVLDSGVASFCNLAVGQGGCHESMTAAHKTLPKGSKVRVTNTANGKSVVVTITDRGPYVAGRVIDLSQDAFASIGSISAGKLSVTVTKE